MSWRSSVLEEHPTPLPALAPAKEKRVSSEGPPLPGVATECANILVFVTGWGAWPGQGFFFFFYHHRDFSKLVIWLRKESKEQWLLLWSLERKIMF